MAMPSMEPQILSEIKRAKKRGRTVDEVTNKVGCHRLTAYKNLRAMFDRGLLERDTVPAEGGRGRPQHVYFLAGARN